MGESRFRGKGVCLHIPTRVLSGDFFLWGKHGLVWSGGCYKGSQLTSHNIHDDDVNMLELYLIALIIFLWGGEHTLVSPPQIKTLPT